MLNIAIVDDESAERQKLRDYLEELALSRKIRIYVEEFTSADSFLFHYEHAYDIVFMDIEFPSGKNGMQAAYELRKMDNTVILIFVTNIARMAVEGYAVDALDFMVKPLDIYAFRLKMTRVLNRVAANDGDSIVVRSDGEFKSIRVNLIRYLKVDGHYVVYHSREGIFSEYISLAAALKKLNSPLFYRCDRGCVVNLRFVSGIKKASCIVDGEELLIAVSSRAKFLKAYTDYLGGSGGN